MVPEVVFMETVNVVGRRWMEERDTLAGLKLGEFAVSDQIAAIVAEIEARVDGYATWLRKYFDEHGISVEPVPPVDHMEIARRASDGRNPFTRSKDGKTKDGYRDTLIWLTFLAVAHDNDDEEVWLVSHNTRDFGVESGESQVDRRRRPRGATRPSLSRGVRRRTRRARP
ncbi:PIN domain-containing protein [Mycobacterium sp. URHB0021]